MHRRDHAKIKDSKIAPALSLKVKHHPDKMGSLSSSLRGPTNFCGGKMRDLLDLMEMNGQTAYDAERQAWATCMEELNQLSVSSEVKQRLYEIIKEWGVLSVKRITELSKDDIRKELLAEGWVKINAPVA